MTLKKGGSNGRTRATKICNIEAFIIRIGFWGPRIARTLPLLWRLFCCEKGLVVPVGAEHSLQKAVEEQIVA